MYWWLVMTLFKLHGLLVFNKIEFCWWLVSMEIEQPTTKLAIVKTIHFQIGPVILGRYGSLSKQPRSKWTHLPTTHPPINPLTCLLTTHPPTHLPTHLSTYLQTMHQPTYLPTYNPCTQPPIYIPTTNPHTHHHAYLPIRHLSTHPPSYQPIRKNSPLPTWSRPKWPKSK